MAHDKTVTSAEIDFDPMLRFWTERRDAAASDRHRRMLDVLLAHIDAELKNDMEAVLATLVDHPRYELYGQGAPIGVIEGRDGVEGFYRPAFEAGFPSLDIERFAIDDDTLVNQSLASMPTSVVFARFPQLKSEVDLSRPCVFRKRVVVLVPFEGDRMVGEIHFQDGPLGIGDLVYLD